MQLPSPIDFLHSKDLFRGWYKSYFYKPYFTCLPLRNRSPELLLRRISEENSEEVILNSPGSISSAIKHTIRTMPIWSGILEVPWQVWHLPHNMMGVWPLRRRELLLQG